jgi:hypothetical protein
VALVDRLRGEEEFFDGHGGELLGFWRAAQYLPANVQAVNCSNQGLQIASHPLIFMILERSLERVCYSKRLGFTTPQLHRRW